MADRRRWLDGESVATIAVLVRGSPERVRYVVPNQQRCAQWCEPLCQKSNRGTLVSVA
jgi:hypothetical protein